MQINRELIKGSTSIMVMALLEREDMYGYQITQVLKKESENIFEMKEGTLYPLLHGLENDSAIEAYWKDAENGKKRKYYHLTKKGKKLLNEKRREWRIYSSAVNSVIGGLACE